MASMSINFIQINDITLYVDHIKISKLEAFIETSNIMLDEVNMSRDYATSGRAIFWKNYS